MPLYCCWLAPRRLLRKPFGRMRLYLHHTLTLAPFFVAESVKNGQLEFQF